MLKITECFAALTCSTRLITLSFAFIASAVATPTIADENGVNRFAVRNCTPAKVLVCAYDKTDSILEIPYHATIINSKEKERFSCASTGRCKVFVGYRSEDINRLLDISTGNKIEMAIATAVPGVGAGGLVGLGLVVLGGAGTATLTASMAAGAAIAAGGTFAVMATVDGFKAGDMCKKMIKKQRSFIKKIQNKDYQDAARDSFKTKLEGRWPKYKNYKIVQDSNTGAPLLKEGNNC